MEDLVGTKQKMRQGADRGLGGVRYVLQLRSDVPVNNRGKGLHAAARRTFGFSMESFNSNRNDGKKTIKGEFGDLEHRALRGSGSSLPC